MNKLELTDRELILVMGSLQGVLILTDTIEKGTGKGASEEGQKEKYEILKLLVRLEKEFGIEKA